MRGCLPKVVPLVGVIIENIADRAIYIAEKPLSVDLKQKAKNVSSLYHTSIKWVNTVNETVFHPT